ncbi:MULTISPECIES: LPXTG cell wall anchor domain-containing protein [Microbacterium]|jgi:LPXTG-motif cell wall-anchored protein|uniref:LPXTG cell wall anchor domain-containing protein n=1 Tax=Microbacterium TaxID=33882 RepID=UPI001D17351F|nr:LPXTG cell wall anchor domain-containing protein [Microbacterium testaceum]MCC4249335.1 LPXTG cell wall anchor domain-containing protein [Microbacterium testaceum]
MPARPWRRHLAIASILALFLTGAIATPVSARTPDDAVVASGEDWTVERAPGGYTVTLRLDEPLPIVSDAPTIVVDGEPIGIARTSDRGRTLTVTTFDDRAASAREVAKGWASSPGPKAGEESGRSGQRRAPETENDELRKQLEALPATEPITDPSEPGPYDVVEVEYDFGDRSVALAGYQGTRGEVAGKLYLSRATGPRPVVVFQHGRHATCGDAATGESELNWPCADDQLVIRSYLGYEQTARALASHGYDVVSVSANAINATDAELTLDQGAQARGRLVLDTLDMLDALNRGDAVEFADVTEGADPIVRSFDEALQRAVVRADQPARPSGLTASDLAGRFDLTRVGLMGHSRGGEGVVTAAQLNAASDDPFGIRSVLPLAPTDFARRTVSDATTLVVLPYCDGDVADQQGQKYIDDSRRAFDDDVLRSAMWVMGANHNFFSSVWTPGEYPAGASDDWPAFDDASACATTSPTRLSAAEQYQVGVSYMTGFFRLTLGGEDEFRPLFDGSRRPSTTLTPFADVRVMATQPAASTRLISDYVSGVGEAVAEGVAVVEPCYGSGPFVSGPSCTYRSEAQAPHWSAALLATAVPALTATLFTWDGASGRMVGPGADARLRFLVPESQRDVSDLEQLTLKAAPSDVVSAGTDFSITVIDGSGGSYSVDASALNPYAVNRMPGGFFLLDKVVLQQITLPLAEVSGVDLTDVREVRLTAGVGADGVATGGVFLSDLAFDSPSAGTPMPMARPGVNMAPTRVDEGAEPWTAHVAVWLDRAWDVPVSAYANTVVSPWQSAPTGTGSTRVTFAPGQTCLAVPVQIAGDTRSSAQSAATVLTSSTTTSSAVSGTRDFSELTIREDDGVEGEEEPVPAFGVQGDVCDEWEASRIPGTLATSDAEPARGDRLHFTATGFRAGEAVTVTLGGTVLPAVLADADGTAVIDTVIAADAALGATTARAEGAGSARVQEATLTVQALAPTPTPTPTPEPSDMPTLSPTSEPRPSELPAAVGRADLPQTGMDSGLWMLAAIGGALFTALGGGVVLVNRRRSGR